MISPLKYSVTLARLSVIVLLSLCFSVAAHAVVEIYEFDTESQRIRYASLIEELRCPKCQNQNLSGSNSEISKDLRRELHRLLSEGKSDQEIIDFMVARYGDFVLYRPRLQQSTLVLWFGPLLLLLLGFAVLAVIIVRRRRLNAGDSSLSDSDEARLQTLLSKEPASADQSSKGH